MVDPGRRMRVLVCGTTFGQVYLEGLRLPGLPFELAGILARGSQRSQSCADHYRVPLFRTVEELPDEIDLACVVVRSGLLGGRGTELAQALMTRGIHVVQEHPVHYQELAECLRSARRHKVVYNLNSFYVHLTPVRRFVAAARELFRRQAPLYIDAACGYQLVYALLDVLGQALGGVRPWALPPPAPLANADQRPGEHAAVFRSLDGMLAGVPLTLRVQKQLHPRDPDNFAHLLHRIVLGTEGGSLALVATHGPVVWCPRPRYPHGPRDPTSRPYFDFDRSALDEPGLPSAAILGPAEAPSYVEAFRSLWPAGVARALLELRRAVLAGDGGLTRGQYHLSLCLLRQDVASRLGPPELLDCPPPRLLTRDDVAALAAAAASADEVEALA